MLRGLKQLLVPLWIALLSSMHCNADFKGYAGGCRVCLHDSLQAQDPCFSQSHSKSELYGYFLKPRGRGMCI